MNLSTTLEPDSSTDALDSVVGYSACLVSCLAFGTMFTPMRKVDSKDGLFVQWVQCSVVFLFGFVINCIQGFPKFEPIAAVGGFLYATGNVFSVPIVDGIGAGLGMLIWGSIQVVVGWSVARFGLPFSLLSASPVEHNVLNYVGMFITLVCGILFIFVRHEDSGEETTKYDVEERENQLQTSSEGSEGRTRDGSEIPLSADGEPRRTEGAALAKLPYILMACCLGVLHGLMMCPLDIVKHRHSVDAPHEKFKVLDYCFSYFSTVFFFSTVYFVVYCFIRRSQIYMKRELVIPTLIYGVLWNVGMTLWFISSDKLAQTVAYPITTRLPAILSALVDVFIFKSIRGKNNVAFLSGVVLLGILGVVLIAISNQKF